MTSPDVGATSGPAAPDLVCVEQLTTAVTLHGSNFTPMPIQTLQKSQELALPSVTLTRTTAIDGTPATGTVTVPDDPSQPANSDVSWQSETQMAFQVTPAEALSPGLYDVTVTNPDGSHKATFPGAFAGVPRPVVMAAAPDILCDAEDDQTMTLQGSGFLQVGSAMPTVHAVMGGTSHDFTVKTLDNCSPVPGQHSAGAVQTCSTATFVIPAGTFQPGSLDLTMTNPQTAACASTDKVSVTVVPPPSVATVAPDLLCDAQGDTSLTITGQGFLRIGDGLPTVTLTGTNIPSTTTVATAVSGCSTVSGSFTEMPVQTCSALTFSVPKGSVPSGVASVVVTNPKPADCYSTEMLQVFIEPPPDVTGLGMGTCDAEGATNVTVTGTGFLEVGTTLPSVQINGTTYAPTSATGCTAVSTTPALAEAPVSECTGLVVNIPKDALAAGTYPVAVTNPTAQGCTTTSMMDLVVEPPPTVTHVQPAVVCTGGGSLTVTGTGFLPTPTVTLQPQGGGGASVASNTVALTGSTGLTATFAAGAVANTTYDVVVQNPDTCSDLAPHQTVTVTNGPVLFFASPQVVYSGINTRVTLYTTSNLQTPVTVTMTPHLQAMPVTPLAVVQTSPHLQVVIPSGTTAGAYDVTVSDQTGCPAVLPSAITVTDTTTVTVADVAPPFGWVNANTAVQIDRNAGAAAPANTTFEAVPTAFLNPSAGSTSAAIQLEATTFTDKNTLTSIVPSGQPTGSYDLVIVNPDGTVGVLKNAFAVTASPPPTITTVAPLAVVAATSQSIVINGTNFRGSPPTLSVPQCEDATGTSVTPGTIAASGNPTCDSQQVCTQNATVNASGLPVGATCLIQLTNADGTYATFSAISVTNSSLNTAAPRAGSPMTTGRRALAAAAANATGAARFVYAIGGDDGTNVTAPFASVESVQVDLFGNMKTWSQQRYGLGTGRSFGASTQVGRYVYLCGGTDGAAYLATCQRSMILDPLEAPQLGVSDIEVKSTGVGSGVWYYKVSATFSSTDPDNPGGESLPSDEVPVEIPALSGTNLAQITLAWSAPTDSKGNALPNVSGYNVYRTSSANGTPGNEVLLATVGATTLTFTDDGSKAPGSASPLPLGSTGKWASLPAMTTGRKGLAMSYGFDPATPTTFYVYSFYGLSNATTANSSYEYLPVTVQPNGHQAAGSAWTAVASATTSPRWQLGAYHVDSSVFSKLSSADGTTIYIGCGLTAGGAADGTVEAGKVAAGGSLGTLAAEKSVNVQTAGYGAMVGADQLFTLGGAQAAPSNGSTSAKLTTPQPGLAPGAWNANPLGLIDSLYLPGVGVQSSFVFLLGGETAAGPPVAVTKDTEILTF